MEPRCVKVLLNFLKQSKVLKLELSEMMRCSADAQRKQTERIKYLETQNEALKNMAKRDGSFQKLTLPLNMQALHLDSYKITNSREISPVPNNYLRSLFKLHPLLTLPERGLW